MGDGVLIHVLHEGEVHKDLLLSLRNALIPRSVALDFGLLLGKALLYVTHADEVPPVIRVLDVILCDTLWEISSCRDRCGGLSRLRLGLRGDSCAPFLLGCSCLAWLLLHWCRCLLDHNLLHRLGVMQVTTLERGQVSVDNKLLPLNLFIVFTLEWLPEGELELEAHFSLGE